MVNIDLTPVNINKDTSTMTTPSQASPQQKQQQLQQQASPQESQQPPPPEEVGHEEARTDDVATVSFPWQYDEYQVSCASCQADFTPLNRRHHCRFCGKIFCHECTNQRALIPPTSIVLEPVGGKKAKPRSAVQDAISFSPDQDPDRMLTYIAGNGSNELLYGKGLEERFKLAREPLRVCRGCFQQLQPLQEELRNSNSNAVRYNHIDPTDPRRMFNSPIAFTLGHEIRKAAYTLNNLLPLPKRMGAFVTTSSNEYSISSNEQCKETCSAVSPDLGNVDGVRIPAILMEQAKGIATLTVFKGGFGLAGVEFGTGLVVARLDEHRWSAPSAIGTAGLAWGALIGAQVSDHVFLLMTDDAVEMMFHDNGSVQLGADVGVAVGPLGRALEADFGAAPGRVAPIYTYSLSKGLYAGISLDGKVLVTRKGVNERFYGREVSATEILNGSLPTPPAARPLYDALTRCHVYTSGRVPTRQQQSLETHRYQPETMGEYGEFVPGTTMPPAYGDQHSYAGMSDITFDPGY